MNKQWGVLALLVLAVAASVAAAGGAADAPLGALTHEQVARALDLSNQFATAVNTVTVKNTGGAAVGVYHLVFEQDAHANLAYLSVALEGGEDTLAVAPVDKPTGADALGVWYAVQLGEALGAGESVVLEVTTVETHVMTPFPHAVAQDEDQLVVYIGNLHFYSPYAAESSETVVTLPSGAVEEYTEDFASKSDETITYGPFDDVSAGAEEELFVHFENNAPFLTIESALREIEVSHWGNVAVEEHVSLRHDGAQFTGDFSRYDLQRNPAGSGQAAVRSFKWTLPTVAEDVYYRDQVGNVSSSHVEVTDDGVEVELIPRFPLFGGWSIDYYAGYNLPAQYYLGTDVNDGSLYVLNIAFNTHIGDAVVDELTVKVVLPEGATDIEVHTPFAVEEKAQELRKTYLDTAGRPVVVLVKKGLVPQEQRDFQVTYRFGSTALLWEPILCISAYFILFVTFLVFQRFDLTITNVVSDLDAKTQARIDALLEVVQEQQNTRAKSYRTLGSLSGTDRRSNDAQKRIKLELGKCATELQRVAGELAELDEDLAAAVRDLNRTEKQREKQMHVKVSAKSLSAGDAAATAAEADAEFDALSEEVEHLTQEIFAER